MLAPCRSFDLGKKASITDIVKFQKKGKACLSSEGNF